jgi:hypothetical protein
LGNEQGRIQQKMNPRQENLFPGARKKTHKQLKGKRAKYILDDNAGYNLTMETDNIVYILIKVFLFSAADINVTCAHVPTFTS